MTETIRYGLIGKEDLALGTSTFEVVLADGRVAVLTQVNLTEIPSGLTAGSVPFVDEDGNLSEDNTNLTWTVGTTTFSAKSIQILASGVLKATDANGTLIHAWGTTTA